MRRLRRWPALLLVAAIAFMSVETFVNAASGTHSDPDDTTGLDIKAAYHSDTTEHVTLGFETFENFVDSAVNAQWDLDLAGNGNFEDCITLKTVAAVLRAQFTNDCQPDGEIETVDATRPSQQKVEFKFELAKWKSAMGLPAAATSYKYRMRNTADTFGGCDPTAGCDLAPDSAFPPPSSGPSITHSLGGAQATATPSPTPTPASTASPSPTPTKTPTPAPTGSASPAPTGSASPSATPCPTATPTPSASASPTPTASASASPSASPTPTASPSSTPTASPTPTATACPHETVTGTPSKTTAEPGDEVAIAGNGFAVSTKLDMTFQSTPKALGSITSSTAGAFSTTVKVPNDATAGAHHIVVVGANTRGGTRTMMFPITVTAAEASTGGSASTETGSSNALSGQTSNSTTSPVSLPRTGLGIALMFGLALTLVLGGMTGLSEAKMRRRLANQTVDCVHGDPS